MVAPAAADLEITPGRALELEPEPLDEPDRTDIVRLDARLEPVQPERAERVRDDEAERLAHQPPAGIRLERVVAERSGVPRVADDIVHVDDADELVRIGVDDEEGFLCRTTRPAQIFDVFLVRARRLDEGAVQRAAPPHRGEENPLAARRRPLEADAPRAAAHVRCVSQSFLPASVPATE